MITSWRQVIIQYLYTYNVKMLEAKLKWSVTYVQGQSAALPAWYSDSTSASDTRERSIPLRAALSSTYARIQCSWYSLLGVSQVVVCGVHSCRRAMNTITIIIVKN